MAGGPSPLIDISALNRRSHPQHLSMEMDESWDADFDGDLRVPDSVISNSTSVKSEVNAARQLSAVTAHLREILLAGTSKAPAGPLQHAASLVQASTLDENDEFYKSDAWKKYGNEHLELGGSIEDVLKQALRVERELTS